MASASCQEGKSLLKQRRYEEAVAAFEHAIQCDPNAAPAHHGKGAAFVGLRRYEEALRACERAIQLDPTSVAVYVNKAQALHALKRYREALKAVEQALQRNPTNSSLQRYRSKLKQYRIHRAYGELWRLYYALIILASGATMAWLAFRLDPFFALVTIAAVLIMLFKTFR
jgi:tetratricopeptide (TPR) repeat protein